MKIKYSLVLPCYNEYGNLKFLLPQIFNSFPNKKYQIIIVDDNSEDQTTKKLKKDFKKSKKIKYILRKKNPSLALSIKEGIKKSSGEITIVMDTDFNHTAKDLKKMLQLFKKNNFDMICGSRFLKGGSSNTFLRHYCSLFFNFFVNFITGGKLSDNLSGFFIIKKKYLLKYLNKVFYGYGEYYIRLLFYMQKKGLNISEMPVKYALRRYGTSKSKLVRMFFLYSIATIKLII